MQRERVSLIVVVDLDPVPGAFHDVASARYHVESILKGSIPHYDPVVEIKAQEESP